MISYVQRTETSTCGRPGRAKLIQISYRPILTFFVVVFGICLFHFFFFFLF
ncbi:hypothetical protein SSAG_04868 [Streptomyces sp. Mg1]|nr:hypothetical protein SSAG_04868 [Streptomyces sp. Mg1]